jgi:hypothetical protein
VTAVVCATVGDGEIVLESTVPVLVICALTASESAVMVSIDCILVQDAVKVWEC